MVMDANRVTTATIEGGKLIMATAHKTGRTGAARPRANGKQTEFDENPFALQESGAGEDASAIESVVRKVLSDVLNEVSEEVESPEGEPPPTGGKPSKAFARPGVGGGPDGTPDDGEEAISPEVSEAVQAVLAELSPEQTQVIASLFEAMGEATNGERQGVSAVSGLSAAELLSLEQATARGPVGVIIKMVVKFLRGPGKKYWRPAVAAARKGVNGFKQWAKGLPWAIRMAIGQLSWAGVQELLEEILRIAGGGRSEAQSAMAGGRTAAMTAGETEPAEIEQVIRKVLAEALSGTQSSPA
jgi:hypothetical protein